MTNPWLSYLKKSYDTIKTAIITKLQTTTSEITDWSENNIIVILVSVWAGITEQIHYYIDNLMRESFISTCRRYFSAVKLSQLIDYRIKAANPASLNIKITLYDANGDIQYLTGGQNEFIPKWTIFKSQNNLVYQTTEDLIISSPNCFGIVPAIQANNVYQNLGTTTNLPNQRYLLDKKYVQNSISLIIDTIWTEVTTLGLSGPTDKEFIIEIDENMDSWVVFGDGTFGAIPPNGFTVAATYKVTEGVLGNIAINTLKPTPIPLPTLYQAHHCYGNNSTPGVGGTGFENLAKIKVSAPLSLRTLDKAVTKEDYKDIAKLHPGISQSFILPYTCGKYVYVYVYPVGGGIASSALLTEVEAFFETRKMVTTFVEARAAGETQIYLEMSVTGRFGYNANEISQQVYDALKTEYSPEKSTINRAIRLSDIYALVDNLSKVDYSNIISFFSRTYAYPLISTYNEITFDLWLLAGTVTTETVKITYTGTNYAIYLNNVFIQFITPGTNWNINNKILLNIATAQGHSTGDSWEFKAYPMNVDQVLDDNSVPIFSDSNITLTITETLL